MPTEQKTSLGLNRWQGTDKPARADFVADSPADVAYYILEGSR